MILTGNNTGTASTTSPHIMLMAAEGRMEGSVNAVSGRPVIKAITLYNPNALAATFTIRRVTEAPDKDEVNIIEFDDSIPATDTWRFGTLGGVIYVIPSQRIELVLDSAATIPIQWSLDWARSA